MKREPFDYIPTIIMCIILLLLLTISSAFCAEVDFLPEKEVKILGRVADDYGLEGDGRRLLFVIRRVEQGGPGREMGVLVKEAQRYKGDFKRSLRLQAEWAAGTIKKRYTGDLAAFAARWAPVGASNDPRNLNKNWLSNVTKLMEG